MDTQPIRETETDRRGAWNRRGLLAGLAGLVAAGLAKLTSKTVDAANGDPLLAGGIHTSTTLTKLTATTLFSGLEIVNGGGGTAIQASTTGAQNAAVGLRSDTTGGPAVAAFSNLANGVYAQNTGNNQPSIFGFSQTGIAISGVTTTGFGVDARVDGTSGRAVFATALGANGIAYSGSGGAYGINVTSPGIAGQFNGKVVVVGDFSATGLKSAVVPDSDGDGRRVYCLESPESFFEDFGYVDYSGGEARVDLEPVFASIVVTRDYFVWLTEDGANNGLFIAERAQSYFVVRANSPLAKGRFAYRVTARRADVVGRAARLQRVSISTAGQPKASNHQPPRLDKPGR